MVRIKFFHNVEVKLHFSLEDEKATNVIYLLKFPNKKYYVGQTSNKNGLINRIKCHCHTPFKKKQDNKYMKNVIKKYMAFDVFLLKKCSKNELDFYEEFYISFLKRVLLNKESGGHSNKKLNKTTKEKISKTLKQYFAKNEPKRKSVLMYDLYGNLIKKFISSKEASEYMGINIKNIWQSCEKEKTCSGYQFRYDVSKKNIKIFSKNGFYEKTFKEKPEFYEVKINDENIKYDTLYEYSLDGEYITQHYVFDMNKNEVNCIVASIKRNLLYKNHQWSLIKLEKMPPSLSRYEKVSKSNGKRVEQIDKDGNVVKVWDSAMSAGRELGMKQPKNIQLVCVGKRKTCGGFKWRYID